MGDEENSAIGPADNVNSDLQKGSNRIGLGIHDMVRREPSDGGTIVVKIGGSTLGHHDTTLEDLVLLQRQGIQPVVVHGGGKTISQWMELQGVRPRFLNGLRVTDKSSLDIVVAVLSGVVNKHIVASIGAVGGRAVGLSGVDGGMLQAEVMDPDLGLVGKVVQVNPKPVQVLVDAGFVPVIAPVAVSSANLPHQEKQLLNVNADTAAGELALALGVEHLVFLTDVDGVMDSSRRLIPRLTVRHANSLVKSRVIAGGMIPKIGACVRALESVNKTHIVDGRKPHVLRELLNGTEQGTRIG